MNEKLVYKGILSELKEAVIVLSEHGDIEFSNPVFNALEENERALAVKTLRSMEEDEQTRFSNHYVLRKISFEGISAGVISRSNIRTNLASLTIREIGNAIATTDDIYHAAANAIFNCLGWRWVSITRFVSPVRLQMLTFTENGIKQEGMEYDIFGTPCQLVVERNKFTLFSDLLDTFPDYQGLHDMGAQVYAGLIYRGSDNQPLGHVMAMHDSKNVDFALAEEVIDSATLALSTHFQLHYTEQELKEAQDKANTDSLTGLGNRNAFDERLLQSQAQCSELGKCDLTIAVIDLNYLKQLNDNKGHQAGDQFISLMGSELSKIGRQSDNAFRIGGDEFVLVFEQSNLVFSSYLMDRFETVLEKVRLALDFYVDASIGIANISETNGDVNACFALADQRMYEDKSKRKA